MRRERGSYWSCGGLTLLQKINNALQKHFTAPKYLAHQDLLPENETTALVAQEGPERTYNAAVAPTQFHRFLDLPAELRLQIWEEATRHKRYVVLDPPCNSLLGCLRFLRDFGRYDDPRFTGERRPLWTSPTPPPALLSVSYEARQVALKVWQPAFACEEFPAAVYINFDQDDVVIRSGARANHDYFGLGGPIDNILRPWNEWVAGMMIGAWIHTDDVEKIQRLVACGNFMKGIRDYADAPEHFMTGLKSLTMIRIGSLKIQPCPSGHYRCNAYVRKVYTRTSRPGKGAALLSLDGIHFAKTANTSWFATTRSFAELEVIDFDGGSASKDVGTCWDLGPETLGWRLKRRCLSRVVHLGPGKRCVSSSKWDCVMREKTNIWYAI